MRITIMHTRKFITQDCAAWLSTELPLSFQPRWPNAIGLNAKPEGLQDTAEITVSMVFQNIL